MIVERLGVGTVEDFGLWCSFMLDSCSIGSFRAHLSCVRLQSRHSEQVMRGADHVGSELHLDNADEAARSQATDRLHPAEDLFDAFTLSLADRIAQVARGAVVESGRASRLSHR